MIGFPCKIASMHWYSCSCCRNVQQEVDFAASGVMALSELVIGFPCKIASMHWYSCSCCRNVQQEVDFAASGVMALTRRDIIICR